MCMMIFVMVMMITAWEESQWTGKNADEMDKGFHIDALKNFQMNDWNEKIAIVNYDHGRKVRINIWLFLQANGL